MKTYQKLFNQITKDAKKHQKQKDYSKFKKIDTHEHITEEADFPEHKEQLEATLKKFPKLIFIIPHYLGAAPKLSIVGEMLDKYPNLYTDISMGGGKNMYVAFIQGFRKRFRKFFKKYHNRLFWGTDFLLARNQVL